jgi:hypothetical protein
VSKTFKMHFEDSRQSNRRLWLGVLGFALAGLLLSPAATAPAARASFVYCLNRDGAKVFAGREAADGGLAFGVSVWSPAGQNISIFGVAGRRGNGWEYTEDLQAATPAERCRLDITRATDRSLRVVADPTATCQSHGGVDAEIGTVLFPPSAYEGIVTTELDDPETFQRAGKCWRTLK